MINFLEKEGLYTEGILRVSRAETRTKVRTATLIVILNQEAIAKFFNSFFLNYCTKFF